MLLAVIRLLATILITCVVGVLSIGVIRAQTQTVKDGVYSDPQARRGEALYAQQCVSCHSADLSGSGAPPLVGTEFLSNWDKMPLADLAEKIAVSMPSNSPGSLSRDQAADLVAFILKSNKFPSGSVDLEADAAKLKTISIIK
jgi:mono/diheme cytochrome c family protein